MERKYVEISQRQRFCVCTKCDPVYFENILLPSDPARPDRYHFRSSRAREKYFQTNRPGPPTKFETNSDPRHLSYPLLTLLPLSYPSSTLSYPHTSLRPSITPPLPFPLALSLPPPFLHPSPRTPIPIPLPAHFPAPLVSVCTSPLFYFFPPLLLPSPTDYVSWSC